MGEESNGGLVWGFRSEGERGLLLRGKQRRLIPDKS